MNHKGFTLAELLVVLAIIGTLTGLTLPAIGSVLRCVRRTACASNLRQIGMGALTYADDWDGRLPAEGNCGITKRERSPAWFDRLPEYLDGEKVGARSVFQCAGYRSSGPSAMCYAIPKSLKMNAYLDEGGRPRHYALGRARQGAEGKVALFLDAVAGDTGMGQWGHCLASAVDDSRHPGAINVLCLDGHTQTQVRSPTERSGWRDAVTWLPNGWKGGP